MGEKYVPALAFVKVTASQLHRMALQSVKEKQPEQRDTIAKIKEVYSILFLNLHP
jgi:hypothetical protein